jgi:hypothetical protein
MRFLNWTKCAIIYDQNDGGLNLAINLTLTRFLLCLGLIQLRDLLTLSLDMDILTKTADSASYHAILQELKDKEMYNMIVDIRNDDMSDFLKAVREQVKDSRQIDLI